MFMSATLSSTEPTLPPHSTNESLLQSEPSPKKRSIWQTLKVVFLSCFGSLESDMESATNTSSTNRKRKSTRSRRGDRSRPAANNRRTPVLDPQHDLVRIRVGWKGKDLRLHPNLNVKTTFGAFSILLDHNNNTVHLTKEGHPVTPLDPYARYVVVVNTLGTSKSKWDNLKEWKKEMKRQDKERRRRAEQNIEMQAPQVDTPPPVRHAPPRDPSSARLLHILDGTATDEALELDTVTLLPYPPTVPCNVEAEDEGPDQEHSPLLLHT
eukprot:TRINITY_DN10005_c0_g1_i2.p1 TRINITY_DN10005_c0_g1~~TRINITY_DN10005_c0_g1_i2.p1  ORF type:complete len:267 (+),score=58.17 TRINITY_DN10005_c0_g1_i2:65-865(+)